MAYQAIENHGIIGDLSTVALVAIDGTIDFMSFPRFDSPTIFASLLDDQKGGYFRLAPLLEDAGYKQLYLPATNVLLTRMLSNEGVSELNDFMVVDEPFQPHAHRLVRRAISVRGRIHYRMTCSPQFNYAQSGWTAERTSEGIVFDSQGPYGVKLRLRSTVPVEIADGAVVAEFTLEAGGSASFVLEDAGEPETAGEMNVENFVEQALKSTVAYWRSWAGQSAYRGRWREVVNRSALVLKLLTSDHYGAMVASPTLGIPERVGGPLNWDYRYCWIRDAAFSMRTLLRLGYYKEADAFMKWVGDRCCSAGPNGLLQLMYRVDGRLDLDEYELKHLEGYRGSYPVRVGNGAHNQLQLDIYGELLDFVHEYDEKGQLISFDLWGRLAQMVDWVCDNWNQADDGIWEVRSGRQEFLYSRLMCWVAIDRAIKIARRHSFPIPYARWLNNRDEIFHDIHMNFWDPKRQCFVARKGGNSVDAAMLFMPLVRFIAPTDPRWLSTLNVIEQELVSDSLVYRYRTEPGQTSTPEIWEGTFCMCSFWYAECLTRTGDHEKARFYFEKMLGYANQLDLYSEELGLRGEQLGNFPQAFTHFALIDAASALDKALARAGETV